MASLDLDPNNAKFQIRAYKPGSIQINQTVYHKSIIVTREQLLENWAPATVNELSIESFTDIIRLKPDVLLIGTGSKLIFLDTEIYGELINHGIGVEIMDTAAASRTYNALAAENRNVIAALILA